MLPQILADQPNAGAADRMPVLGHLVRTTLGSTRACRLFDPEAHILALLPSGTHYPMDLWNKMVQSAYIQSPIWQTERNKDRGTRAVHWQ